mmetsp:Transcript_12027/g.22472  ORF Transcript_12027/g.22472 Transcript_12027/m.22472 type:complete len:667 (+) Transcript_12027:91-2091(+)
MVCRGVCLCSLILALAVAPMHGSAVKVTPVQQVVTMLEEMKTKGAAMMKQEAAVYQKYAVWVKDTTTTLSQQIITSKSEIEKLTAFIDQKDAEVDSLGGAIAKLDSDIGATTGDLQDATKTRASENAEYTKTQKDYSESVDALVEAIQVLEKENYDRATADAFLQKMAVAKKGMSRVLAALIQLQTEGSEMAAPEVAAYEFQGGAVIALLNKLLVKFKSQLADVEDTESNQAHQFQLESMNLKDMLANMEAERKEKAALKAKAKADSASAVGDLGETKLSLADDEKTKKDTEIEFALKTEQFEANQKVRKDELAALTEAAEILKDPKVSASYAAHINLVQLPAKGAASFLQVRSASAQRQQLLRGKVAEFLSKKAKVLSSKALAQLATEVAANPFAKVIQMIEGLLAKLKSEAAAESSHKEWCDDELKKNKLKREKKSSKVELLTAEVAGLDAEISSTKAEISKLSEEQAELAKDMAEATAQRTEEKATNEATIKDAQVATQAVAQATAIIKEFYASQTAFLQGKQVPELAAYKGMGTSEGGVVGMLEVIATDFQRLETETTANEKQAASEYAEFMSEAKASAKAKHDLEFKLSLDLDKLEFKKMNTQKDLDGVQVELDKANEYYGYLTPQCTTIHVSYEERVAKRKEEIEALKQAYGILDEISSR